MGSRSGRYDDDDLAELRAALRADARAIAEDLLGPPPGRKAGSRRREIRWGAKGSLAVVVSGHAQGSWYDHEAGTGGDMLGLIRREKGCDFATAVAWARGWTGIGAEARDGMERLPPRARPAPSPAAREAEIAAAEARADRISKACRMAAVSVPIAGTPGDWYLRQVRGIPTPAGGWPGAFRWHPVHRAIVAVATTADGTVQAVQRIHLGADGGKATVEEQAERGLPSAKITNGCLDGAAVRLPGNPADPLLLAEGPETGLGSYVSTGFETWIALGSIGTLQPPMGRRVVVVSDDNPKLHDARRGQAARALRKAVLAWRAAGIDVVVATPWEVRRYDKSDMADLILASGAEAVRARIMTAAAPPPAAVKRVTVAEGRAQVGTVVNDFLRHLEVSPTDLIAHAVRVTVGIGKSSVACAGVVRRVVAMREDGDDRCIALAVPRHDLADELLQRLRDAAAPHGLVVETWRGRSAADPNAPGYAGRHAEGANPFLMCREPDRIEDAHSVGLSTQEAVCRRVVKDRDGTTRVETCPRFETCAYQAQRRRSADIWVVAHDMLYHRTPSTMGAIAALVVDEASWASGLIGVDADKPVALSLYSLMADTTQGRDAGRLRDLRRQLHDALRDLPLGPVRRDALSGTLLTVDSAIEARRLEWSRKLDPMHPGQSTAERKAAMAQAEGNKTIGRLVMTWTAIQALLAPDGPDASGWIEIAEDFTEAGPVRVLRLKGRKQIAIGWQAPTLLLDATLDIDLVRPYWPRVALAADVRVAAPHQRVWQAVSRTYAKSMLAPLDAETATRDPQEANRRKNTLRSLRAQVVRQALACDSQQVLVVMQKAVEAGFRALGPLPANVSLAHHNDISGRDEWGRARLVIVVGRTQPNAAAVETLAEALTGRATPTRAAAYDRVTAHRELAGGSTMTCEADRHPDPIAEAVRWQIAEGQLVQIIGRGRGVNRGPGDPLDVMVLTDLVLPMPIDGELHEADLRPSIADRLLADTGLAPTTPAHAARCHPERWKTTGAARQAFRREAVQDETGRRSVTIPNLPSLIGTCHTPRRLRRIVYQVAGPGHSTSAAYFSPELCPDPASTLSTYLGPLAWHRIEDVPDDEPTLVPYVSQPAAAAPASPSMPAEEAQASKIPVGHREASWPLVPDPRKVPGFLAAWAVEGQRAAPH